MSSASSLEWKQTDVVPPAKPYPSELGRFSRNDRAGQDRNGPSAAGQVLAMDPLGSINV